jgi:hypothetical protein
MLEAGQDCESWPLRTVYRRFRQKISALNRTASSLTAQEAFSWDKS